MKRFAMLQTGIGTGYGSTTYYGPIDEKEADAFVQKVREEFKRLTKTAPMSIVMVEEVPREWKALKPEEFKGFRQI